MRPVKPQQDTPEDDRLVLDRLVNAQLRAEHDGDIEAILAPMAEAIVHDEVGLANNPIHGLEAVRRRYDDLLPATVHGPTSRCDDGADGTSCWTSTSGRAGSPAVPSTSTVVADG